MDLLSFEKYLLNDSFFRVQTVHTITTIRCPIDIYGILEVGNRMGKAK